MKKNILVVDDSALMRRVECDIINSSEKFEAKDTCRDGLEAYEKIKTNRYDAVILDINMPKMNGLELLKRLKKEKIRATVIVVSSLAEKDGRITIQAMENGAIDFLKKPENIIEAKGLKFRQQMEAILNTVLSSQNQPKINTGTVLPRTVPVHKKAAANNNNKLVALACSTGGPRALQSVVPFLDKNMDAPMILVQHMPSGFTKSMAERLNELSKVKVKEAEENDILKKGCVYVAPGGYHMEVVPTGDGNHKIHLSDAPAIGGLRPCANVTYRSLKKTTFSSIVCVVMTGMGADGTEGIRELNESKPIYVIAQDEASCVVYGMPKAIAESGLTDEVVTLTDISKRIINQVGVK